MPQSYSDELELQIHLLCCNTNVKRPLSYLAHTVLSVIFSENVFCGGTLADMTVVNGRFLRRFVHEFEMANPHKEILLVAVGGELQSFCLFQR